MKYIANNGIAAYRAVLCCDRVYAFTGVDRFCCCMMGSLPCVIDDMREISLDRCVQECVIIIGCQR